MTTIETIINYHEDNRTKSVSTSHEMSITDYQKISIKLSNIFGEYHVEFNHKNDPEKVVKLTIHSSEKPKISNDITEMERNMLRNVHLRGCIGSVCGAIKREKKAELIQGLLDKGYLQTNCCYLTKKGVEALLPSKSMK